MAETVRRSIVVLSALAAIGFSCATVVRADTKPAMFAGLSGAWSGTGKVEFEGDKSENVKCLAYYRDRDGGVGLALRCSSATGGGIEIRANFAIADGAVSGTWEERKYNASGDLKGMATGGAGASKIAVEIEGGGLAGTMTLTTTGTKQQVAFISKGWALRGVNIALTRD